MKVTATLPNGTVIELENGVTFEQATDQLVALGILPGGAVGTETVRGDQRQIAYTNPTAAQKAN